MDTRRQVALLATALFAVALNPATVQAQGTNLVLAPGRAGMLELGATVDEIYRLVGRERVRLVDVSAEGHFTPAIEIRLPGAKVAPSIVARIREVPCLEFAIDGISVLDPRFRTSEGIGAGSTVGELRHPYDVRFSREERHSVIVPSLKMSFAVGGVNFQDSVRVTSVWLWPDPSEVRRRRCPDR